MVFLPSNGDALALFRPRSVCGCDSEPAVCPVGEQPVPPLLETVKGIDEAWQKERCGGKEGIRTARSVACSDSAYSESQDMELSRSRTDECNHTETKAFEPRIVRSAYDRHTGGVRWGGKAARAVLDKHWLWLSATSDCRGIVGFFGHRNSLLAVPLTEIIGAEKTQPPLGWASLICGCSRGSLVVVHTIRRKGAAREWHPHVVTFACETENEADHWVRLINGAAAGQGHRPKRLLVFINPFGGSRQAKRIWADVAAPILARAGVVWECIETEEQDHARRHVGAMEYSELSQFDGIVAVGGDGLFQEAMTGLMKLQESQEARLAQLASEMRMGHIPAGSTDAVTYTVNGTRSAAAAALHIALGDRMALDVMEIGTASGQRKYAVCLASYGFMGDLMKKSEGMRWIGPARYDVAGALTFLRGRSYRARIRYTPAAPAEAAAWQGADPEAARPHKRMRHICQSECRLCQAAAGSARVPGVAEAAHSRGRWALDSGSSDAGTDADADTDAAEETSGTGEAQDSTAGEEVRRPAAVAHVRHASTDTGASCSVEGVLPGAAESSDSDIIAPSASGRSAQEELWEGDIAQLMCAVTPCRSDKSRHGVVPYAHMADGRMHLILVRQTNRINFLRFLASLQRRGIDDSFGFVEVKEVTSFQVEPIGEESSWNIDGELLGNNRIRAKVHQARVQVFARGIERQAAPVARGASVPGSLKRTRQEAGQGESEVTAMLQPALSGPATPAGDWRWPF